MLFTVGTPTEFVLAQNITLNQSANMNTSMLTPSGNLTNRSSIIISNTT
jgi:hypothetical protein